MKETAIRLREFAEDWANTPIDTDVDIRRLNVSLFLDQLMRIIDDGYMSNELVNQEVEKRIAERMLTDEDIIDFALLYVSHKSLKPANRGLIKDAIIIGMKQLRSRLTKPGAETSQKTEGGEG